MSFLYQERSKVPLLITRPALCSFSGSELENFLCTDTLCCKCFKISGNLGLRNDAADQQFEMRVFMLGEHLRRSMLS